MSADALDKENQYSEERDLRSSFRKKWDTVNSRVEGLFRKIKYRRNAKIRLKRMNGGFALTNEYQEIVKPYWEKYGYIPKKYWYKLFADREQKVDPRYIPDDLYYGGILPYFSNTQFRRFGEDKCYHDFWFPDVCRPKSICKNIAGVFYDSEMNLIDIDKAVKLCIDHEDEFVIKPSIDSGEGRLIRFFTKEEASQETVASYFREMGANFIVQACVRQHPTLASMNPSSLNTIRVVSFFFEGEVHILSHILRVGAVDSRVDNIGAGGFACPILSSGQLQENAVNRKAEWVKENSFGIPFKDITIPNFQGIIDTIKRVHTRLPHFKLIGWDFSIDEECNPVFIEFNSNPGTNQMSCGPTFGNLTERVLTEYFITRSLSKAQN